MALRGSINARSRQPRSTAALTCIKTLPAWAPRVTLMSEACAPEQPSVDLLLDVDREYREKAEAGLLRKIALRSLTPEAEAWLPVLHTHFGPWHFTALFSNTEHALEPHRTPDWVVIYFTGPEALDGQVMVVTERRGALTGKRVVRGHEPECAIYYDSPKASSQHDQLPQARPL